jgi:hypothetical protein
VADGAAPDVSITAEQAADLWRVVDECVSQLGALRRDQAA